MKHTNKRCFREALRPKGRSCPLLRALQSNEIQGAEALCSVSVVATSRRYFVGILCHAQILRGHFSNF